MSDQINVVKREEKHEHILQQEELSRSMTLGPIEMQSETLDRNRSASIHENSLERRLKEDAKRGVINAGLIEAGAPVEVPRPRYSHVGFDEASIKKDSKDSHYMTAIKDALQEYYDAKHRFENTTLSYEKRQQQTYEMLDSLKKLRTHCNTYMNRWWPLTIRGWQRRFQVKAVREQIDAEIKDVKSRFVTYMDTLVRDNLKDNDKDHNRYYEARDTAFEIKLQDNKNEKEKHRKLLDFSGFTRKERADYLYKSGKDHISFKSEEDLKRTDLTEEERKLLENLNEYGEIRDIVSDLSVYESARMNDEVERFKAGLDRERELLPKIREDLRKILGSNSLSQEKKDMFLIYQKRIDEAVTGTLELPKDHYDIYEEGDIEHYYVSDDKPIITKDPNTGKDVKTYKREEIQLTDRSKEPLFAHEPCAADIGQTNFGNCFLLSTIGEIVARDPAAIKSIMKDEGDTVLVKLNKREYRHDKHTSHPMYVRVKKSGHPDFACDTLWVQLLVKAYTIAYNVGLMYDDTWTISDFKNKIRNETRLDKTYIKGVDYSYRYTFDNKSLDFGLISNGGSMPESFTVFEQGEEKEATSVIGSISEITTVDIALNQYYEGTASAEQQQKIKDSGKPSDMDFSVTQLKDRKVVYIKETDEKILKKYKEYMKSDEAEGAAKKEEYDKKKKVINIITLRASVVLRYKFEDEVDGEMRGGFFKILQGIDTYMEKDVYDDVLNTFKVYFDDIVKYQRSNQSDKEWQDDTNLLKEVLKDITADNFIQFCKDVAPLTQSVESYDYRRRNKDLKLQPGDTNKSDERVTELTLLNRLEICSSKLMDEAAGQVSGNLEGRERYQAVAEKIRSMTLQSVLKPIPEGETFKNKSKIYDDNRRHVIIEFAYILGVTFEEGFEMVKAHALKELEMVDASYQQMQESDTAELFSGQYSPSSLKLFDQIKNDLRKGKHVGCGTRLGWGSKSERGESEDEGTVGSHAYAILDTLETTFNGKKIKMIKVRNPWAYYTTEYYYNEKTKKVEFQTLKTDDSGEFYIELTHFTRVVNNIYEL